MATASTATPWFALAPSAVADNLNTSLELGLDASDAERRLATQGPNVLAEPPKRPWWPLLLSQFTSPLTVILLVAVGVSLGLGESVDAGAIGSIVMINAVLGFVQEWRAGQAIDALTSMMALRSQVIRGGEASEIDAARLVPGDLVVVRSGDRVPADLRLVEAVGLVLDESALTGEPFGIDKGVETVPATALLSARSSLLHAGTDVAAGHGRAIVVATGDATEFGSVVGLAAAAEQDTIPLQRSLAELGRVLGVVSVGIAAITVAAGIVAGRPAGEMLITGISLAVAIVPEGLPAVVTVTLALGIKAMSKRRALLRHLEAAETLGAASIICTDKTGTLTQNQMRVHRIWTDGDTNDAPDHHASPAFHELLRTIQLCNRATIVETTHGRNALGDPTEAALLMFAADRGAPRPTDEVVHEIPFDSATKAMTVFARAPGEAAVAHVKGAPEIVLSRSTRLLVDGVVSSLTETHCDTVRRAQAAMTEQGLRTLAVASRIVTDQEIGDTDPGALVFIGLLGLHDPPRPEVENAVATALRAGLIIVVMTGDAPGTGLAIATEVGLAATGTVIGPDLDAATDAQLLAMLDGSIVLSRVTPAHKMRVVRVLQSTGAVVAMTGDGVNDAPALEQASIGIAMGERGTDVARQASDVVLADDNFASIVAAIEEGRRQYANIRKFVRYLLSSNLGEVVAITGSVLLGWPLILLPAQILWMNLLTDGVTALALGLEPSEPGAMDRPPRDPRESIIDRAGALWIGGMGMLIGLTSLAVFRLSLGSGTGADLVRAQTLAFTAMVLMEKMNVFNFRSERASLRSLGLFSNPWLAAAWISAIVAQVAAVHLPGLSDALGTMSLTLRDWLTLAVVAIPVLMIGEANKALLRRHTLDR